MKSLSGTKGNFSGFHLTGKINDQVKNEMLWLATKLRTSNCSARSAVWLLTLSPPLNAAVESFSSLRWPPLPTHLPCWPSPWKCATVSCHLTTSLLLSPCTGSLPQFAALLPSTHFQISFFFLERCVARPLCRWALGAKWGIQDKSPTWFTPSYVHKKQVWSSCRPKLGITFLLCDLFVIALWSVFALWFDFFSLVSFPNTNSCPTFFVSGMLSILLEKNWECPQKHLTTCFMDFTLLFFFNFFYCFCFTILASFFPNMYHLWPPSHILQLPAHHHTMPSSFWVLKVEISRTEQSQENFGGWFVFLCNY